MREPHFEIYRDKADEWRWRLLAANGRTIADSGEGYKNYTDCWDAVFLLREAAPKALVEVK